MSAAYRQFTVIGLGLIGSSIARAARQANIASRIVGVDSNEVSLAFARKEGFVDATTTSHTEGVVDSDVVVIATPTYLLEDICKDIAPFLSPDCLVMDTGSVKQLPTQIMNEHLAGHGLAIPTHPIAGSEQRGVMAGRADLFEKKKIIITPDAPPPHEVLQQINQFWQSFGGRVEAMPPLLHDTIYGYVSHLPQLLAFALAPVLMVSEEEEASNEILRRFVRLCHSDVELWCGILLLNAEILHGAISRYLDVLVHIRQELENAPKEENAAVPDESLARTVLVPRIVASCLITTVMEAEKNSGAPFVRYSGSGFADFTSPATSDPEQDMEQISAHYPAVLGLLIKLEERLTDILAAISQEDASLLATGLE